jgi:hypothetical protein
MFNKKKRYNNWIQLNSILLTCELNSPGANYKASKSTGKNIHIPNKKVVNVNVNNNNNNNNSIKTNKSEKLHTYTYKE